MQSPANQSEFAGVEPAVDELHKIVSQAEQLLRDLEQQGGEAAGAVRERVTETLNQTKSRLAASAVEAEQVVEGLADRADKYVRANPWQSVAIAALLGGALTLLITRLSRK